jgi:hypothetical protein
LAGLGVNDKPLHVESLLIGCLIVEKTSAAQNWGDGPLRQSWSVGFMQRPPGTNPSKPKGLKKNPDRINVSKKHKSQI